MPSLISKRQYRFISIASQIIRSDFYVDDLLRCSNNVSELNKICTDIFSILKGGGFILRKRLTNEPAVLAGLTLKDVNSGFLNLGENESSKTLGIHWHPQKDLLKYRC